MQKRIICILLSLLLCVVTGCSAGNTDIANKLTEELTETAEKITSPAPNSSMIPSFGTVAPHYPTPTPSASVSAPAEETPQTAYAQVYSEKLKGFYEFILTSPDELEPSEGETGVMEVIMGKDADNALNSIGYAIEDINGDEIPELLICAVEENGADFSCGSEILAAYTCADKMPQYCFEGWSRSSYHYLGDGEFFYQGSGGAMYSMFGVYTLSQDGSGLSCEDYYFTFEKNEGSTEIGFYHNTSGAWDKSLSQELSITSELFWQMAAVFEDQIQSIPLIPFSAYEG